MHFDDQIWQDVIDGSRQPRLRGKAGAKMTSPFEPLPFGFDDITARRLGRAFTGIWAVRLADDCILIQGIDEANAIIQIISLAEKWWLTGSGTHALPRLHAVAHQGDSRCSKS
ncbi:hypothetical protein ACVIWU_006694 [Bradyrhizobium sp. USDA 4509]